MLNMNSCDQPNILFLRKCFLRDCGTIEDMFDERLIDQTISEDILYKNIQVNYNEIPIYFTGVETWIKKTNLKCWFCDCCFNNIPIFIPDIVITTIENNVKKFNISTIGNFCSFNCAAAHIELHYASNKKTEKHNLLKLLYKIMNSGMIIHEIIPSPPKVLMQQYGGRLTNTEYSNIVLSLTENNNSFVEHNDIKNISRAL